MTNHEVAQELLSIKEQIDELLGQAQSLLPHGIERTRAEAYWIPHIKSALGGHGYNAMCSMTDTITELEEADGPEEE